MLFRETKHEHEKIPFYEQSHIKQNFLCILNLIIVTCYMYPNGKYFWQIFSTSNQEITYTYALLTIQYFETLLLLLPNKCYHQYVTVKLTN